MLDYPTIGQPKSEKDYSAGVRKDDIPKGTWDRLYLVYTSYEGKRKQNQDDKNNTRQQTSHQTV